MNPAPLVICLSPHDIDLRDEIAQRIKEYATIDTAREMRGPESVELALEVLNTEAGIPGSVTAIVTFLRALQTEQQAQGRTVDIAVGQRGGTLISLQKPNDDVLALLMEQMMGIPIATLTPPVSPASPQSDLEANIRESYAFIRQCQEQLKSASDPNEQAHYRAQIAEQQQRIKEQRQQYAQLCKELDTDMAEDITAIAIIIDFEFSGKR